MEVEQRKGIFGQNKRQYPKKLIKFINQDYPRKTTCQIKRTREGKNKKQKNANETKKQ